METNVRVSAPFLRRGCNTRGMMCGLMVMLSLLAAHFAFRYDSAFAWRYPLHLLLGAFFDMVYTLLRDGRVKLPRSSVFVTTALLVLSVPAHMPWWQISLGTFIAIWFGKRIVDSRALRVNPMLLGRLFMMIVFANSIQEWLAPGVEIDALSSATPLGFYYAEDEVYSPVKLLFGNVSGDWEGIYEIIPGSPGEVFPLLSLVFGIVLFAFGVLDWRPGVAYILGMAVTCPFLGMPALFHVIAGSTFFTAVFIISDPRSMPSTKSGRLLAGFIAGGLNAVIRWHGYLPEGVVPAVIAVNLLSPTLDRLAFWVRGAYLLRQQQKVQ